jgi:hypothetical protein
MTSSNLSFLRQDSELAAPPLRVSSGPVLSPRCCGSVLASGLTSASVGFTFSTATITFRRTIRSSRSPKS